ncbi:MAG: hypothetical protein ACJZ12_05525 [Candidatus Neomarinimicrobiota bacterium]
MNTIYLRIYFSISHPDPKQISPPSSNLGSMSFGNFIIKPTAIINIPNSSKAFAA